MLETSLFGFCAIEISSDSVVASDLSHPVYGVDDISKGAEIQSTDGCLFFVNAAGVTVCTVSRRHAELKGNHNVPKPTEYFMSHQV